MKNINIILIILFFIGVKSTNLISFKLIAVDDCIKEIYISDKIVFNLTRISESEDCNINDKTIYPEYLIHNYEYEYGTNITFKFEDRIRGSGYMNIIAYFNEYIIKASNQKFWKCINCMGENNNYLISSYKPDALSFYLTIPSSSQKLFQFIFNIDNYNEQEFSIFDVNDEYFSFTDKKNFYIDIHDLETEVELINFNDTDNFYITNNKSFPIDINNYKFEVNYINKGEFNGQLKALNFENKEEVLESGFQFKVSNQMGIRYQLDQKEIENKKANVSLRIKAFNYPYQNSPYSKQVAKEEEFNFIINIYGKTDAITEENKYKETDQNKEDTTETIIPENKTEIKRKNTTDELKYTKKEECPINKYFLQSQKKCVDNCYSYPPFIYIYKDECVEKCPSEANYSKNHICIIEDICELYEECPKQYPYMLSENKKCTKKCEPEDFFNKICKIQNNNPEVVNDMINNIKKSLLGGPLNSLVSDDFSSLIINENNIIYSITREKEQDINNNGKTASNLRILSKNYVLRFPRYSYKSD